jgi:pimeloyl-ACP methyl ester carboxylesterase
VQPHPLRRVVGVALAAAALAAAACTSGQYARLVPERTVPARAAALAQGASLARVEARVAVRPNGFHAFDLALERLGPARPDRTFVLLHGVLSDRRAWRYVTGALAKREPASAFVLVDLPGCGQSDAPDPRALGDAVYEPSALAEAVLQGLEAKGSTLPPGPVVLCGHSLGGTVVLRALSDPRLVREHATFLARVEKAVLFAPVPAGTAGKDPSLDRVATCSDLEAFLAVNLGILREESAKTVIDATTWCPPVREEADRLVEGLACAAKRRAGQAMLRQVVPTFCDGHPDWPAIDRRLAEEKSIEKHVLVVWGMHDTTLPVPLGYRLVADLKSARLETVEGGTHSLPVEAPDACADALSRFAREPAAP